MPADAIVKAFHDPAHTLKGAHNLNSQQNMNAITKLQNIFTSPPGPMHHSVNPAYHSPRVAFHDMV